MCCFKNVKYSNSSKMSLKTPAESTPLTCQTRSTSHVIYFCWLRQHCVVQLFNDVESTPVCDYIVLTDWYQLEGGGTPLCRIFWTDTLRNFEKRFLSIKFVQLSKKSYIDVQISTSVNIFRTFHPGQLKS